MSVAGYKLRIDGVTVIDVGNVLTHDVTGLAAGSSHGFEVLAYDQAGNESEYCDSVVGSTLSPPSTSIYIDYDPAGLALANNDPISTLVDSVAARNATQSGSNRPTYVTNAINTSLPAIDFLKSSAEYFNLPNLSALTAATSHLVVKCNADPPSDSTKSGLWKIGTTTDDTYFSHDTDGIVYDGFGTTVRKTVGDPTPSLASWRIYSIRCAAGVWTAYLDGTQIFTTATNTVGFTASPTLGRGDTGTRYFDGRIARWIIYSVNQTNTDFNNAIAYLKAVYGIA